MEPSPSASTAPDPRAEYVRRLDACRDEEARRKRLDRRLADIRLVLFVAGLVLAGMTYAGRVEPWWIAAPVVLYLVLLPIHERAGRAARRAGRAAEWYERGRDRLDGRWAGRGEPGTNFLDERHPYAADLDLFGPGSLFERLCTARTASGQATLAAWLLAPADPEEVVARQGAVAEWRPRLDFREDLALLGEEVREGVAPDDLIAWGAAPPDRAPIGLRLLALVLAVLAFATLVGWLGYDWRPSPFLLVVLAEMAFHRLQRGRIARILGPIHRRADDLALLAGLLGRLEREPAAAPRLARLRAALDDHGEPPSRPIARLARLVHLLDARENQIFTPFAGLMLWGPQLAYLVEDWRAEHGPAIAGWLAVVGEAEALSALAAYAFENPADPFPETGPEGPSFEALGLAHPLIPISQAVRNDVALGGGAPRLLVVSGSNMSGKSTLLRSVGTNAVLAQAGAPVRAVHLSMTPLAVGATLRIQDSLQQGRSRFFAEITRVRLVVDLARGPLPLLFLLDELFSGTNSHDRRAGAEAVVAGLLDRGALGLITTHDLALAAIADRLAPRAANVHFEDQFRDGTLHFDYRMRPGVVRHSNALALMRAVGLDV